MPIETPSNNVAVNTQFQLCWIVVALLESTIFYLETQNLDDAKTNFSSVTYMWVQSITGILGTSTAGILTFCITTEQVHK